MLLAADDFTELPLTLAHTTRVEQLTPHHADPFDRMLIAQALVERATSGRGQVVDAAMVDGVALLAAPIAGAYIAGYFNPERGTNWLDSGAHYYDVYETAESFVVHLEVPGIAEEDIEVHVDGDTLVVKGQRQPASRMRPDSFHRMERSYGSFSRSFQLSDDVDPERVTARFKDGLLRVELPKLHVRGGWRLREKA